MKHKIGLCVFCLDKIEIKKRKILNIIRRHIKTDIEAENLLNEILSSLEI